MISLVQIGPYDMVIMGDTVSVTDSRLPLDVDDQSSWVLPETRVEGLAKHIAKGVAYKLCAVEDMEVIYIIQRGERYGWSYAINLSEPIFSEWGSCGIYAPKEG